MKLKTCLKYMQELWNELESGNRKEPIYCCLLGIWYKGDGKKWVPYSTQNGELLDENGNLTGKFDI